MQHVYENNALIKTEKTLIIERAGCGKASLMLSLLKDKNPDDVCIICKTNHQYPSKYLNQSSEILSLEDFCNKTIVFDDMLGSKEAINIDAFFLLVVAIKVLTFFTSLIHVMNYIKTQYEKIVVGLCCFHQH